MSDGLYDLIYLYFNGDHFLIIQLLRNDYSHKLRGSKNYSNSWDILLLNCIQDSKKNELIFNY